MHVVSAISAIRIDDVGYRCRCLFELPSSLRRDCPPMICQWLKTLLQSATGVNIGQDDEADDESNNAEEDAPLDGGRFPAVIFPFPVVWPSVVHCGGCMCK